MKRLSTKDFKKQYPYFANKSSEMVRMAVNLSLNKEMVTVTDDFITFTFTSHRPSSSSNFAVPVGNYYTIIIAYDKNLKKWFVVREVAFARITYEYDKFRDIMKYIKYIVKPDLKM